jgi:hypothetical protein
MQILSKSLSHASHKDKVFDDLVKHAKKIRANLVVTESFIFSLCYRHCTASRLASKQNGIVLVEDLRRINVTYDCLLDACGNAGPSIKRLIAQNANIPIREELSMLRSVEFWGY